jgi:hypothetical protein
MLYIILQDIVMSFDSSDEKNNIERSIFNMKQWFDMRDLFNQVENPIIYIHC